MPAFALIRKSTDFYEKVRHIAVGFGTTQGVGFDFTSAKNAKAASKEIQFGVTASSMYSLFSVTRKLIRQSQNRRGAIAAALERESTLALKAWKRDIGIHLFKNPGAAIGQVASGQGTSSVTLVTTTDVRNFEINMSIQASADDGWQNNGQAGATTSARPGFVTIVAIDRVAGILKITGNWTDAGNIPGILANDFLFRTGNYAQGIFGFDAWLPVTNPSSGESYFGVDRSVDPLRLSGVKKTVTGLSAREGLMALAMEVFNNGGSPTHEFRHTIDYLSLQLELQAAGNILVVKEQAEKPDGQYFGQPFEGVTVMGPTGPVKIFPDYNQKPGKSYMMQLDTWTLAGIGDFPYIDAQDGNRILREESADAYEGRIVGDIQPYTEAPGYNCVGTL
jgi:hypothetical protein